MEIRVLDFEKITRHYLNYQNGVDEINAEKDKFLQMVDPIRKEMESIIRAASSGLVVDRKTEESRVAKFQELQQQLSEIDSDYKHKIGEMRSDLNKKSYDELEVIVTEWSEKNSIDLVTGKMEVIFSNPKYDSTDEILEILKEKDLFIEKENVEEKEKESV